MLECTFGGMGIPPAGVLKFTPMGLGAESVVLPRALPDRPLVCSWDRGTGPRSHPRGCYRAIRFPFLAAPLPSCSSGGAWPSGPCQLSCTPAPVYLRRLSRVRPWWWCSSARLGGG